jgi:hypothetical protein
VTITLNRREAIKAGAAFVLGFYLPQRGLAHPFASADAEVFKANAWVRVTSDNRITVLTEIPEMGQGTRTANVMMLADELEWSGPAFSGSKRPPFPKFTSTLSPGAAAEPPPPGCRCEGRALKHGNCCWRQRLSNGV